MKSSSLYRKLGALALIFFFASQACAAPTAVVEAPPTLTSNKSTNVRFMTIGANATPTPTPFLPLAPTPTPVPTATPTPEPTSTLAIVAPEITEPLPFRPVEPGGALPDDVVNFLVLGSDARPGGGFRTDVMMLVSINRSSGTVSVVSFPRDLYVNIPYWMTNRLNVAMQLGGFSTMADTFQQNFGVRPSYYVMTNFAGFKGIIDSMGGIDVKVEQSLHDSCDLPWADGAGNCTIDAPATVPMSGEDALWYVRSRKSSSDFDRLRRAQEVLRAIFVRLMSIDVIGRIPEIYDIYHNNVETNLTLDQILPLIPIAQGVMQDTGLIRRYTITPSEAVPFITPEGAMVLWPNLPAIQAIVYEAVYH